MALILNTELDAGDESALASLRPRLQRALPRGWEIETAHFAEASPTMLRRLGARCVVLSGQGTPLAVYPKRAIARVRRFLEAAPVPVLGICGGHQLIALAFGGVVAPMRGELRGGSYEGLPRQRGYVEIVPLRGGARSRAGALFHGVPQPATFWENHVEEVKELPQGFLQIAREEESPCQAMRHRTLPIYGVQFHPERFSRRHRAGRILLANFFAMC